MCSSHNRNNKTSKIPMFVYYFMAILFGALNGYFEVPFLIDFASMLAGMFVNMFKFVGLPLIVLSLIVIIGDYDERDAKGKIWQKACFYTFATTLTASLLGLILYLIIKPSNIGTLQNTSIPSFKTTYFEHISGIIPTNIFTPFIEGKVLTVLLIGVLIGITTRFIPDKEVKNITEKFFKGIQSIIFTITGWIIQIMPIGLFAFVTIAILDLKTDSNIMGLAQYLTTVISANLIQGLIILPLMLLVHKVNPIKTAKGMSGALSLAFFSKSSAGTLPVTMQTAENNLGIKPKVSRFVLPLCTSINMNGCAAFIFITSIFVMQNNGIEITLPMMLLWVVISVITAVGNAGVPMGCFFLTTSLLVSINVPINLMMIILPFYALIDMIETALNVWSDACVTVVIDKSVKSE
jgi:Na+/H+-dicarboxylate symporter